LVNQNATKLNCTAIKNMSYDEIIVTNTTINMQINKNIDVFNNNIHFYMKTKY